MYSRKSKENGSSGIECRKIRVYEEKVTVEGQQSKDYRRKHASISKELNLELPLPHASEIISRRRMDGNEIY